MEQTGPPIWCAGKRRRGGRHERRAGGGLRVERCEESGSGARFDECGAQTVADEIVDVALLAEAKKIPAGKCPG